MKKTIAALCIIMFLFGCKKDDENSIKNLDDFIGFYCGENTTFDSWAIHNTEIARSETASNKILIFNFANTGENVEATINADNTIVIAEQVFVKKIFSMEEGSLMDYNLTISGEGILNTDSYFIQITYVLESDYQESTKSGVIKMYNSSKLEVNGNYSGYNASAIISEENDSLLISISFEENGEVFLWENIKGIDDLCDISFSSQDVSEINSGATQKINGGGSKLGDKIEFWIEKDWDNGQGFNRYEFSVLRAD